MMETIDDRLSRSTALAVDGVSKRFGSIRALQNVALNLDQGRLLAVLGPSGCGKTTLLRCIAGFETPDTGSITLSDTVVFQGRTNRRPEHRRVGYVPQHGVLFPHLSVANNIAFGLTRFGVKRKKHAQKRVDEMLELVGMEGMGQRMPHELSGGQQQRVALARALAPSPSLVLLDEPFSALDAGLRASLRDEVQTALKNVGATTVMVTHDQEEALSMADLVAVMRQGHCVQVADPMTLYKSPTDLKVASFVGETTMLPGQVAEGEVQTPFGRLPLSAESPGQCDDATIMIRPEQFIISPDDTGDISGCIQKSIYYGHDSLIHLKTDEQYGARDIQVRVTGPRVYTSGEHISLRIAGSVMAYPQ